MIRIVKMTFQPDRVDDFLGIFHEIQGTIAGFEGCERVSLLRSTEQAHVFFTYSVWRNVADLENYRNSDFFKETWSRTKLNFAEKAEAWSVDEVA